MGNPSEFIATERPQVIVVGKFDYRILVQCSWEPEGEYDAVSVATLDMLRKLGVHVIDDPDNYLRVPGSGLAC